MSEYIEKTSAIEAIKAIKHGLWEVDIPSPSCPEYAEHHEQMTELMGICDKWIEKLQNMPDVEPKTGKWIDMGDFEQCSVCTATKLKAVQSVYGKVTWIKTDYCPYCGAKMEVDND